MLIGLLVLTAAQPATAGSTPLQACSQLNVVKSSVDSILRRDDAARQFDASDLVDASRSYTDLPNWCQASIAVKSARLLKEPELIWYAAVILYRLGPNARLALPAVRQAYRKQSAWMRRPKPGGFVSGPDLPVWRSLWCLQVSLATGKRDPVYCSYLRDWINNED
jgi:hypothetical protein